jgi:hypothetical protein
MGQHLLSGERTICERPYSPMKRVALIVEDLGQYWIKNARTGCGESVPIDSPHCHDSVREEAKVGAIRRPFL